MYHCIPLYSFVVKDLIMKPNGYRGNKGLLKGLLSLGINQAKTTLNSLIK